MEVVNRLTTVSFINLSPTSSVRTHLAYLVFLQGEMVPDWNIHGMALKSIYTKTKITLHFTKLCFCANSKSKMADSGNIAYLTHKYILIKNYWTHWSKCIAEISINSLYSACPYHTHGLSHFENTNLIAKSWFLFLSDTKFQDAIFSIAQCVGIRQ